MAPCIEHAFKYAGPMIGERIAWFGNLILAVVMFVVGVIPMAKTTATSVLVVLAIAAVIAFILMFPWRQRADGSAVRLINTVRVSGRDHRVQTAEDSAPPR